jgi:hypothetical protein
VAELLYDAKLAADRALAAGWARVDEQARARRKARYARLLSDGHAASPPAGSLAVAARVLPGDLAPGD